MGLPLKECLCVLSLNRGVNGFTDELSQCHRSSRAQVNESQSHAPCSGRQQKKKKKKKKKKEEEEEEEEGTVAGNKILVTIEQADRALSAREGMAGQRVSSVGRGLH